MPFSLPDYLPIPKSVTSLTIDDPRFSWESKLPDQILNLTLIGLIDPGKTPRLPPKLKRLTVRDSNVAYLGPFPASLQVLVLNLCERIAVIKPLPPVMTLVEIAYCHRLDDFSFLPSERMGRLTLSGLSGLRRLTPGQTEVEHLTLKGCEYVTSLGGINVTGSLRVEYANAAIVLKTLTYPVESLELSGGWIDHDQVPATVKHLSLDECRFSSSALPATLESLTLSNCSVSSLHGFPEDLIKLKLSRMKRLHSYEGLPRFLQHITIRKVRKPRDFPRLRHLLSAELDYVMTKDGTEYTGGSQYLEDSKCRAKSARSD